MSIIIRKATKEDIPSIYNLVLELAVFEKEPDAVTATIKDYEINFENGLFEALVAEHDGEVIGMALYYMTFSTWKGRMLYLEDFVVTNTFRRKGVGKLIFDGVIEEVKSNNAKLLKWQVLDWNESAIAFYKKYQSTLNING